MNFFQKNIRLIIYCTTFLIILYVQTLPGEETIIKHLFRVHTYSLLAFTYLYLALLTTPLYIVFPKLPLQGLYVKARRAIGISTFIFAALHGYYAFFAFMGGFGALKYWSPQHNIALLLGFLAFLILTAMALTSNDTMLKKLGRNWKKLHRFVYPAGVLILLHATTVTVHLVNLKTISVIAYIALLTLFLLQSIRIGKTLNQKYPGYSVATISIILFTASTAILYWMIFFFNHHPN